MAKSKHKKTGVVKIKHKKTKVVEIKHRNTGEVLESWEGDTLAGADLRDMNLNEADLRGADLRGTRLDNADLVEADLRDVSAIDTSTARRPPPATRSWTNFSGM